MYTQHSKLARYGGEGDLKTIPIENGPTVKLLSQDGSGVRFLAPGDDVPETLPAHEFFATHREAYPGEIAEAEEAFKPKPKANAKTPA